MTYIFPSPEWLVGFQEKLNTDEKYAFIARNWEGDLLFMIQPDENLQQGITLYLDLWHGKCRSAHVVEGSNPEAKFQLSAPFGNWKKILDGELQPMQAMMTQKLKVKGNMAYLMRHVPTVLEFARCAQEVTQAD